MSVQPRCIINRARTIVDAAFTNIAGQLLFFSSVRPFSYWDNYYGQHPEITSDFFRLLDYETIQRYDNKGWVARKVAQNGASGLFPATYFSTTEALQARGVQKPVWFIKPTYSTGGKGIQVVSTEELESVKLPKFHIIQEQVTNIELLNERKYTARAYVFVVNKQLYLFDDGFVMLHGVPYHADATDLASQVEHAGYTDPASKVKVLRISDLPAYGAKFTKLKQSLEMLKPALDEFIEASSATEYGLLGIDLIFDKNHTPTFIEVNSKANFVHTTAINTSVNIPFFAAVLSSLYSGQLSTRLSKI